MNVRVPWLHRPGAFVGQLVGHIDVRGHGDRAVLVDVELRLAEARNGSSAKAPRDAVVELHHVLAEPLASEVRDQALEGEDDEEIVRMS